MFHGPEHLPKASSNLAFLSALHLLSFYNLPHSLRELGILSPLPSYLPSLSLSSILIFIVLCLFAVLGIKSRALTELGKHSTTVL